MDFLHVIAGISCLSVKHVNVLNKGLPAGLVSLKPWQPQRSDDSLIVAVTVCACAAEHAQ